MTMLSCQQESTKEKDRPLLDNVNSRRLNAETDKEYAAKLARVGEILVNNPVGITHAHDMFNKALEFDPQNNKALLYSSFTGILMTLKGSMNRGKALMDKPEDYDNLINHLTNEVKYPEYVDFLIGKQTQSKFNNYQDIKSFLQNEVVDAYESASVKLNKVNGDVKVILTQLQTETTETRYDCQEIEEDGYTYTDCKVKSEMDSAVTLPAKTITVDLKDVKMLASGFKAYSAFFKLYTAYTITGQKHISNEVQVKEINLGRSLTDQETHRIVKKYPEYLVLEKDHRINEIVQDLEGIIEVGMDLEALNNQFCNNELRSSNLVKTICFSKEAREDMQKTLDYLSGPQEVTLGQDINGEDVKILIDLPAYLNNPVADLKSLIPTEYNEDGTGNYTVMPELNGFFPNNDLLEKLKQVKSE
ncbi:MAG: hypothetical protein OEW87_15335 [Flavobacteriaceae bacterium]|nr:hypothetical protein [Flavobacteriaceae bacterium]